MLPNDERVEKDLPSYVPPKQAGVAILISDKVDIKPKLEESRRSLHTNKRSNTTRGNNNR
jgi:hypothetical protein